MSEIQLDITPSGKEEFTDQFNDPDGHRKRLENQSLQQDIEERKAFADRAYAITQTWVGFLIVLTLAQFLLSDRAGFGLTELEFNVVFSTTTASVLAFWYLVGKYLFNPQGSKRKKYRKNSGF